MIFKTNSGSFEVDLTKVVFLITTAYITGKFLETLDNIAKEGKSNQREIQQLKRRCEHILDGLESR